MMIFVISSWRDQWSNVLYRMDASLTGYGTVKSVWGINDVRDVGRVPERARYRIGAESARASALHCGGFLLNENGKVAKDNHDEYFRVPADIMDGISARRWVPDPEFPEVPPQTSWREQVAECYVRC